MDFEWKIDGATKEIKKYRGTDTDLVIPADSGITGIGVIAFVRCETLETLVIPEGVERIAFRAFYNCKNLREVTLPSTLSFLHAGAFENCEKLHALHFPNGVHPLPLVSKYAFRNCPELTDENGFVVIDGTAYRGKEPSGCVTVPEGVRVLSRDLFDRCEQVTEVRLPKSLRKIDVAAFQRCSNLEKLELPPGLTEIHASAFFGCEKLFPEGSDFLIQNGWLCAYRGHEEHVVVPEGVTHICSGVFSGSILLTTVTLPDSLISIGSAAFAGCLFLKEADLPPRLQTIGPMAFYRYHRLRLQRMPPTLKEIGFEAYFECPFPLSLPGSGM